MVQRPQPSPLRRQLWLWKAVSFFLVFGNCSDQRFIDTVSLPNYTGSPGFGEAFLQDLVGRCGELDVQDCIATARYLIAEGVSEQGPGKQFITGGSHGGFLTAHRT